MVRKKKKGEVTAKEGWKRKPATNDARVGAQRGKGTRKIRGPESWSLETSEPKSLRECAA